MQASAFLNGRKSIDMTDVPILMHCLWNRDETIPTVIDVIGRSFTEAIDSKLKKLEKEIEQALKKASELPKEEGDKNNLPPKFALFNYFYYTIRDYKDGKCLFYKSDYNYISVDTPLDGIIYKDDKKQAWIIHAIYTGAPFDYKVRDNTDVKKIKLQKCKNGIIIDGTPYGFERQPGDSSSEDRMLDDENGKAPNMADLVIATMDNDIRPQCAKLQALFTKTKNTFLSDDDLSLMKNYLTKCGMHIEEIYVKAQNTQKLL